jgi:hypothetical protein
LAVGSIKKGKQVRGLFGGGLDKERKAGPGFTLVVGWLKKIRQVRALFGGWLGFLLTLCGLSVSRRDGLNLQPLDIDKVKAEEKVARIVGSTGFYCCLVAGG